MKIEKKETILGNKITYSEGKCKIVFYEEDEKMECVGFKHKDHPFLAPVVVPAPKLECFSWNFSNILITNDEDIDQFLHNTEEIKQFLKKIKDKAII